MRYRNNNVELPEPIIISIFDLKNAKFNEFKDFTIYGVLIDIDYISQGNDLDLTATFNGVDNGNRIALGYAGGKYVKASEGRNININALPIVNVNGKNYYLYHISNDSTTPFYISKHKDNDRWLDGTNVAGDYMHLLLKPITND